MKVTSKHILKFSVLIVFLLLGHYVYSRAGGAHGSSGGSSGSHSSRGGNGDDSPIGPIATFVFIVWGIYTLILTIIIFFKNNSSLKIINRAKQEDGIWDLDHIKKTVFDIYCKMQKAWETRNLGPVKKIMSSSLYNEYDILIMELRNKNEKNIMEEIEVNEITIISTKDYKDNNKDAFTAIIAGDMIDYGIHDQTNSFLYNSEKEKASFKDCYEFIRVENKWVVNKIYNDPNIFHIIDAVNYKEK